MKHTSENKTLIPGIVEAIRDLVFHGQLREGEVIHQTDLAQRLGVSSVPLREALRCLEAEGLVTFLPYRGTIVKPVTAAEIQELHVAALALEVALLGQAVPRYTERDLQALQDACDALAAPEARPDQVIAWYRTLLRPAGMPMILQLVEGLVWRSVRFFAPLQEIRQQRREIRPTREDVVAACRGGDAALAQRTLTDFLNHHQEALMEDFAQREQAVS